MSIILDGTNGITSPAETTGAITATSITGLTTPLSVAQGGTNNAALGVTAGGIYYGDGSKIVETGAGTTGQVLTSQGASAPIWAVNAGYVGNSIVIFGSSGTWTVPAGITQAIIYIVAGGGGGRQGVSPANGGYGGSAVAYCTGISGTLSFTIGIGGTGGNTANGTAGTASSITGTGVSLSATGGAGATASVAGADGVGTVTTGTLIAISNPATANGGNAGARNSLLNQNASGWSGSSGTSPVVFSVGTAKTAGGAGLTSTTTNGGCGGAVLIQY